jgi:hypothetical protein
MYRYNASKKWEALDCSATVVGPFHAVTDKRLCLKEDNLNRLQLRVGQIKSHTNGNYGKPTKRNYASILPEDAYAIDSVHEIGKILLFRVRTEIVFSSEVKPICVSGEEDFDGGLRMMKMQK